MYRVTIKVVFSFNTMLYLFKDNCQHECDGRCLEDVKICNGYADCSDGSDEQVCDNCDGPDDFR